MKLGIFGASGFAKEVAGVALAAGWQDLIFLDLAPDGEEFFGFPLCSESQVETLFRSGFAFATAIGDNAIRRKIALRHPELSYPNLIHPDSTLGPGQDRYFQGCRGNIVCAGARFSSSIEVSDFGVFGSNCVLGHDGLYHPFIHVAPGAIVSGNVEILEGAYLGAGSVILQGASTQARLVLGKGCVIGAGAVVTRAVPDQTTVKGVPAR